MGYYLYILKLEIIDKNYTDIATNPENRLVYHNTKEKGFTSRYRPWKIVFNQKFESKELALAAERKIKKWKSRLMTEKIVNREIKL
jgi:putative endonuclease